MPRRSRSTPARLHIEHDAPGSAGRSCRLTVPARVVRVRVTVIVIVSVLVSGLPYEGWPAAVVLAGASATLLRAVEMLSRLEIPVYQPRIS